MVIDYLDGEDAALSRTSVVCRAWLARSRVHLFKSIVVTRHFVAFAAFLHVTPHLRPYIRRLVLQGHRLGESLSTTPTPTMDPALLACILSCLPRLRSLQLHEVSFHIRAALPHPQPRLLPSFELDELTLMTVGSHKDTTNDVLRVLGLFTEVHSLTIASVTQSTKNLTPLLVPRALRVRSLKLEDVPASAYLRALGRTESVKTLTTIDAECVDLDDMQALSELLRKTGEHVRVLSLNLAHCFDEVEYLPEEEPDEEDLDDEAVFLSEWPHSSTFPLLQILRAYVSSPPPFLLPYAVLQVRERYATHSGRASPHAPKIGRAHV